MHLFNCLCTLTIIALKLTSVVVFVYSFMTPLIQLLPNSQKMPMKLCLSGSDETDIMFFTVGLTKTRCAFESLIEFNLQVRTVATRRFLEPRSIFLQFRMPGVRSSTPRPRLANTTQTSLATSTTTSRFQVCSNRVEVCQWRRPDISTRALRTGGGCDCGAMKNISFNLYGT